MVIRSSLHIEGRHTSVPEQLLHDIVDSVARTGSLVVETGSVCLVFGPEHAHMIADAGWSKADVRQFVYDNAVRSPQDLDRVGKGALARQTNWRLPIEHPDAIQITGDRKPAHTLRSPNAVQIIVAGAPNAGVSTILETFGFRDGEPALATVAER